MTRERKNIRIQLHVTIVCFLSKESINYDVENLLNSTQSGRKKKLFAFTFCKIFYETFLSFKICKIDLNATPSLHNYEN